MKRKRGSKAGHKKGKKNKPLSVNDPTSAPVCLNTEDSICSDQNDVGRTDFEMDIETPSQGSDKLCHMPTIGGELSNDRPTGTTAPGRVKVKLKSSRALEPQTSYSDAQTPSDTARSNPQASLETNYIAVEKEDSTYSDGETSEMQNNFSENIPRKTGSIKIKSSRGLGFSIDVMRDKNIKKLSSPQQMPSDRNLVPLDYEKSLDSSVPKSMCQRETKLPRRDPRYSDKELRDALTVIKKVMRMEAAVPFNDPVNPVALGIPDYFDIIDNPMDFGTICQNLELGSKYMNSEDVYKDVQFIWENCYKYNNKGDYIIDLMKRVKKNFMKYWIASGLHSNVPSISSIESSQIGDATGYAHDKLYSKKKSKHKRRRYGIDLHKSDCLCAVCVVRRRRKELEESQVAVTDASRPLEFKLEESSPIDNPCSEDATSSLDASPETDANADVEEADGDEKLETPENELELHQENELELHHNESSNSEAYQRLSIENGTHEDPKQQFQQQEMDLDFDTQSCDRQDNDIAPVEERKELGETSSHQRFKLQEEPFLQENHSILRLCRRLFPSDRSSVWNGPHSLSPCHASVREGLIHAAVSSFLKR